MFVHESLNLFWTFRFAFDDLMSRERNPLNHFDHSRIQQLFTFCHIRLSAQIIESPNQVGRCL